MPGIPLQEVQFKETQGSWEHGRQLFLIDGNQSLSYKLTFWSKQKSVLTPLNTTFKYEISIKAVIKD